MLTYQSDSFLLQPFPCRSVLCWWLSLARTPSLINQSVNQCYICSIEIHRGIHASHFVCVFCSLPGWVGGGPVSMVQHVISTADEDEAAHARIMLVLRQSHLLNQLC
jgi:hypothetical protein